MSKNMLKSVFLLAFIGILGKALVFSFDFPSTLALLVSGGLLFSYDFINSSKKLDIVEKKCEDLTVKHELLIKEMQTLKTASSLQNMGQINKSNPFPQRLK